MFLIHVNLFIFRKFIYNYLLVLAVVLSILAELVVKFKTRIEEHIKEDNKSHIFKHSITTCFDSYNSLCFKIIDTANSKLDLKIKEALYIN